MDLAAGETAAFILGHIPKPQALILDVGCGSGLVAGWLLARGHEVLAIDESVEMVQQARTAGIDARVAAWPLFEDAPFDVVLFASSLHHLYPLAESVEQARRLLAPAGRVIVEDFAWAEIDPVTAEWFYGVVRLLASGGVLAPNEDSFVTELAQSSGAF
jgi:SAM-dependent methyltransferase